MSKYQSEEHQKKTGVAQGHTHSKQEGFGVKGGAMKEYPLVLSITKLQAEKIARKALEGFSGSNEEYEERYKQLLHENLKRPAEKGWEAGTTMPLHVAEWRAANEGRNIGLLVSACGGGLACIDIDDDNQDAVEFADRCGRKGALVVKGVRGWHIWLRVKTHKDLPAKPKAVAVDGMMYQGSIDLVYTAKKQVVLPITGTPRGEVARVVWMNKQSCGRSVSLTEFFDAIEALPAFEVEVLDVLSTDSNDKAYLRNLATQTKGVWRELFGDEWYNPTGTNILKGLRNAKEGRRNYTLFEAAKAFGFLGIDQAAAEEALLSVAEEIFVPGDPELRGGALKTIKSGYKSGVDFAKRLGHSGGWRPKRQETERSKVNSKRLSPEQQAKHVLEVLKNDGALYYNDGGKIYILDKGLAVTESKFSAYWIERQGEALSERAAEALFALAANSLSTPQQVGLQVVLLTDYVSRRGTEAWMGITIQKGNMDDDSTTLGIKNYLYGAGLDGHMTQSQCEEIWQAYNEATHFSREYAMCAKVYQGEDGVRLRLSFYKLNELPSGVYLIYGHKPSKRIIQYNGWVVIADGITLNKGGDRLAEMLLAVLKHESFEIELTKEEWQSGAIRSYMYSLSEYHSIADQLKEDAPTAEVVRHEARMLSRTAMLLTATAIESGVVLIDGAPGSGKTVLSHRLSYLAQGDKAQLLPKDLRDFTAAIAWKRCIMFEEADKLPQDFEAAIKSVATGGGFIRRELFSDDTLIGDRNATISCILNTTQYEAVAPDMARRMLRYTMQRHNKRDAVDFRAEFEKGAGVDGVMLTLIASVAYYYREQENRRSNVELVAKYLYGTTTAQHMIRKPWVSAEVKNEIVFPDWVAADTHPVLAKTYYAIVYGFGIDQDVARSVWREARQSAANVALGPWKEILDAIESDKELANILAAGAFGTDIAKRLRDKHGYKEDEANKLAMKLSRRRVAVIAPLELMGWKLDTKSEYNPKTRRKAIKFFLTKIK